VKNEAPSEFFIIKKNFQDISATKLLTFLIPITLSVGEQSHRKFTPLIKHKLV
jgi:hypothetical protein